MKVLLICGSVRPDSYTLKTLEAIASAVEAKGAEAIFWKLGEQQLPVADPAYHGRSREHPHPLVHELVTLADAASAFVLGSPVYHNSYSGVLKNCLDHLSIQQFACKPVGIVCHGDNLTAVQACDHLRIVVRSLYGIAIPSQVVTSPVDFKRKGEEGLADHLVNPRILKRIELFAAELFSFCQLGQVLAQFKTG